MLGPLPYSSLYSFFFLVILYMLGKHSITELQPQPLGFF
jgi:hypothetical protein